MKRNSLLQLKVHMDLQLFPTKGTDVQYFSESEIPHKT